MSFLWVIGLFLFGWYLCNRPRRNENGFDENRDMFDMTPPTASSDEVTPSCCESSSSETQSRNRRHQARARERFWRSVRGTNARIRQRAGKLCRIKSRLRNSESNDGASEPRNNEEKTPDDDSLSIRAARLKATAQELGSDGAEYIASLEKLRRERAAAQERWVAELDRVAKRLDELHSDIKTCVVDLEPIRPGERAVRLPCLHVFHADCLLPYFDTLENPACPIDRFPIPKEDVNNLPTWIVPNRYDELD